jgi:hypothetical protein
MHAIIIFNGLKLKNTTHTELLKKNFNTLVHDDASTPLLISLASTSFLYSAKNILCCTRLRVNEDMVGYTCCKFFAIRGCWVGGSTLLLGIRGDNSHSRLEFSRSYVDP